MVAGSFDAVGVVAGSLDDPRVGPVPPLRVECFFLAMPAMTVARMRSWCSGGKGRRIGGAAAGDADGALELDPVRVNAGLGGGPADQGRQGVMGQQVAVDFLPDHVRALGPQHSSRVRAGAS